MPGSAFLRALALIGVLAMSLGPLALVATGAGALTMDARLLLQGHARAGAWAAIQVDLQNDGPAIDGELRVSGGPQTSVRFSMAVNLPTGSRQRYVLHAQPPTFGENLTVDLVSGGATISTASVAYLVHDQNQQVVGVLAEHPQALLAQIHLPPNAVGTAPALVPLTVADLPERVEGWGTLDRLVWQDVDSNQLSSDQLTALRQWLAAGGRLVIVGGSAGIGTLSAFPDDLLPYRPTATLDLDPGLLGSMLGSLPDDAAVLPAMAGAPGAGRVLVTSADRAVAGELAYGSGRVTLLGFDPATPWLAASGSGDALWRSLLPDRLADGTRLIDDTQLTSAVYQLPALALPPTTGLLVILGAYIVVIGPLNYLVLRRLDRRELAWITMPILVLAFAAASFGYGSFLHGTDVAVNEVAIVRGAPDTTEATADVYFGVFSPTRSTYQLELPQGALLAGPINGEPLSGANTTLDVVQGTGPQRPSLIRNLTVGTGAVRIVRAELPVIGPRIRATLRLEGGRLVGTVENASDEALENVAVVLGTAVTVLGRMPADTSRDVDVPLRDNPFQTSLADQVVGASFDTSSELGIRRSIRYSMVQQLTYDPSGAFSGALAADQPVVLAFADRQVLDLKVGGQEPRRNGNILYYVPVPMQIRGSVTFASDLLRPTVLDSEAQLFSKERLFINMGAGSATMAYRPIPFEGTFEVSEIRISLSNSGNPVVGGVELAPLPSIPELCLDAANSLPKGCQPKRPDFLPEVEVFDRSGEGAWRRLPRLEAETGYTLADPGRYVDPATGQLLVRFVNETAESTVGFAFQVALDGQVR